MNERQKNKDLICTWAFPTVVAILLLWLFVPTVYNILFIASIRPTTIIVTD